eukprot:CAMPEP_0113943556 /NCGR_PEP_ID=MMETSP1339-20121228/26020_1 /TAXON_ID=94617 /ORGANISM="Fibrocapsa japonica" /LENGTH=77 /DNA_ID=CAMNT_0000948459 /DNA_START=275 /DNA_END=508 /DNA_ORIENTATION=+ /assembly_acc=CAM_ASM_000762
MIDLASCITVKSAEAKAGKRNAFEVATPEQVFLMVADSEKEKDEWVGNIGKAIVKSSSMYTKEDGREDSDESDPEDM